VDLVRILAEARQVLAPLLAQRLRQDMLDRQVADLKVDLLRVTVALLEPFEDDLALRAAAAEVERACPDCLTELVVRWPVAALPGQLPPQRLREAVIVGQVLDELDEQPVQRVGRNARELAGGAFWVSLIRPVAGHYEPHASCCRQHGWPRQRAPSDGGSRHAAPRLSA
jgi:hypothetical protein